MAVGGSAWAVPAQALAIVPVYDSSITNDPNVAQIPGASINNLINSYYDSIFTNNVTVDVNITDAGVLPVTGGAGASNLPNEIIENYAATVAALQSHATGLDSVAGVEDFAVRHQPFDG